MGRQELDGQSPNDSDGLTVEGYYLLTGFLKRHLFLIPLTSSGGGGGGSGWGVGGVLGRTLGAG